MSGAPGPAQLAGTLSAETGTSADGPASSAASTDMVAATRNTALTTTSSPRQPYGQGTAQSGAGHYGQYGGNSTG